MKPVLKYRGGKYKDIPYFEKYIPKKYNRYIEPFFGGGALYFYLEPELAIINDINSRLMEFYSEVQNNFFKLKTDINNLVIQYKDNEYKYEVSKKQARGKVKVKNMNEILYYTIRDLYNYYPNECLYSEGAIYYFINKTAYSGMIRYNKQGKFNVPFGRYKSFTGNSLTRDHSELLQKAELYNTDYCQIFKMTDENDFMFLDPPYDCIFNDYGNLSFTKDEQEWLALNFKNLSCKALMVIGETPLTAELYKDYICDRYYKKYAVNIRNRFHSESTHLIVKNY